MPGENKTLEKLITIEKTINELVEMRHQIIELKASEAQRQLALSALQSSESKYRTLTENIPHKLFIKDKNSVYVSCNQNYAQDLRIKADEIVGKTDYDFFPRNLAEKYIADDKRILEKGKAEDIEDCYIQNGQEVIVHTVKTPVRDEKGDITGVLGVFWDITEQKQREEKIKQEQARLAEQANAYKTELQKVQESLQQESNGRSRVEEELRRQGEEFKDFRVTLEKKLTEGTAELRVVNEQFQKEITERKRIEEEFGQKEEEFKKSCTHLEEQLSERTANLQNVREQLEGITAERQRLAAELREAGEKWHALERQMNLHTTEWQAVKGQLQQELALRKGLEEAQGLAEKKLRDLEGHISEQTAQLMEAKGKLQRESDIRKQLEEDLRRKEEETNRLVGENTLATEIGRIVGSTKDLKEVYERFADFASQMGKLIPFDRVATTILNPEDNTLGITYVKGVDMTNRRAGDILPLSGTSAEEIMKTRTSLLVQKENQGEAIERFPDLLPYFEAGFRSLLFVPLMAGDQIFGILNFLSTQPDAYTQVELRLAEKVANQVAGAIANAQHFLDRKRVEETLKASEQKYRSGLYHSPVGIWVSVQEKIYFANPKLTEILGYSQQEFLSQPLTEIICPEERKRITEKYSRWAIGETPSTPYISKFIHKEGHTKWLENKVALIQWEGEPAVIHFVTDVTERKQAEETLRKSVEPFRRLVQSMDEIIFSLEQGQK